jgi:hypothetical protein
MNLTKNQIYIISAVILAVIVYFMFFRNKGTTSADANKMVTPPMASAESNWMPSYPSQSSLMSSMRMGPGNSVAGMLGQSNYAGLPEFERPTALAGDATNWLMY